MFGRKRAGYTRRGWGYRSYYPYKRARWGSARAAYTGAAAAKKGTKVETYNGQVNGYCSFTFAANSYRSDVQMFMPFFGAMDTNNNIIDTLPYHGGILNDKTYRLLTAEYDQQRLVSMKIKFTPTSLTTSTAPIKLLSVCDRNCYVDEQSPTQTDMTDIDQRMTSVEIENNPGVIVSDYNGNRVTPIIRYCTAKDTKERTDFHDSSIYYLPVEGYESNPLYRMYNNDFYNNRVHFAPCFFVTLKSGLAAATQVVLTYSYTVEYNIVFRNPKNNLDGFIAAEITSLSNKNKELALQRLLAWQKNPEPEPSETKTDEEEVKSATSDTQTN